MRILILGAGKMGSFFSDLLSFEHEVAIYDIDPKRLRFVYNVQRLASFEEIREFDPEFLINSVSLNKTEEAFISAFPYISENCIISDLASVKNGLKNFYIESGRKYVSVHPMFGPTFANLSNLVNENAIIISDRGTDYMGLIFFRDLFSRIKLNIREYSFDEHDEVVAYSLSIPFASTLVFGSVMEKLDAPGTTFKKHLNIAQGLMGEDDYLLSEILFNKHTNMQLEKIIEKLTELSNIIEAKDGVGMSDFLAKVRCRISQG